MPEKKQKIQNEIGQNADNHNVKWEAGKFCLDIAKLVFGGAILAGLIKQDIEYSSLFTWGLGAIIVLVGIGFLLLFKSKKIK